MDRKYVETNINSVLNWALVAFGRQEMLADLFEYYGFSFEPVRGDVGEYELIHSQASEYAEKYMPAWPHKGYIFEKKDYVIVNIGN